ncbi:MAG: ATP-binding cassette domain-containing protein [Bacillota bacterium]|nr:ATP-binding cassette domain-containing protein [Bacillota bacterium]
MIEVRKLIKIFPNSVSPAVDDVSFTVGEGNICVFVGPSGCGKTTILRMINRLVEPTSGEILINGENIKNIDGNLLRRRIGYVIQHIGLLPHRTVEQNVALVPRLLQWPEARIRERNRELLELVGLDADEVCRKYPYQLSGGQMQRVGVARALAVDPPIMLMDEPFGAVDPIIRSRLQDEFINLQHKVRKTICFVTHDINEAIKMGDHLIVLQAGKLIQSGSPLEILSNPVNDFVADLIGDDRGVKLLDLTRCEILMKAPGKISQAIKDCTCQIDAAQPVKIALEAMMKNDTDLVGIRRNGQIIGTLSWDEIKKHINKISGE